MTRGSNKKGKNDLEEFLGTAVYTAMEGKEEGTVAEGVVGGGLLFLKPARRAKVVRSYTVHKVVLPI